MAGNQSGGYKAAETNKKKYGSDFYRQIGAKGGAKSRGGGFAANPELAQYAGRVGGICSRRNGGGDFNENAYDMAVQDLKQYKSYAKYQRN
jgi:general stress protein YciG